MPYFAIRGTKSIKTIIIMQSKGAIRFVAILLAIACLWQLSFTAVTKYQENKAAEYAEAAVEAAQNSAAFAKVAEENKAFYLDSLRKVEGAKYRFTLQDGTWVFS